MSKYQKHFLITILLVIVAVSIFATKKFVPGLDIAGGMRVVLQANTQDPDWPANDNEKQREKMNGIRDTIHNRVKGLQGVTEALVVVQGSKSGGVDRLVVELPGVKDPDAALRIIQSTAMLKFYYLDNVQGKSNPGGQWRMDAKCGNSNGESYVFIDTRGGNKSLDSVRDKEAIMKEVIGDRQPILTGKDILPNAKGTIDPNTQKPEILVEFNKEGAAKFAEFTTNHVGDILAVFLDDQLLTAPSIKEPITDGSCSITGSMSVAEARKTAELLNAGALPIALHVLSKDTVAPTLGSQTIKQVIFAGIAGLSLVILFMLIYYRLPGLIADVALILYALFVMAFFKAIGATMSLPGVAALIISIGMAVDANILIFERLKEELRSGKTLRAAIDAGFGRAFTAIFDSNMCTAITCGILMWYGSPSVQSFALTLLVGVAISMFTAITVTRTILHLLVTAEWAQKPSLYGLGTSWMSRVRWNIVGSRNWFFALSALLIVPGVIFMFLNRAELDTKTFLKEGIEFRAGTSIEAKFNRPVTQDEIRTVVAPYSKRVEVQMGDGGTKAFIKTDPLAPERDQELRNELNKDFGLSSVSTSSVGPTISSELKTNAVLSVLFASAAIILYLTFRFAIGGLGAGLKFGVCAVIALIHDALFILGLFAILGRVLGWEIDSLFVTAVLTIIGFSVHDTIVVFDRIRENLRHREPGETFEQMANRSIIQTLSRSINTSMTVVLTLLCLIAFGGPLLRHFYVAMLAGIIIGTYSSIFNATPLVIVWEKMTNKVAAEPQKKAFEDKALVEKPMTSFPGAEVVASSEPAADGDGSDADKSTRIKRKTTKKRRF